jgi:RNA polymerase sigma-70 factor (ECF subfamily)
MENDPGGMSLERIPMTHDATPEEADETQELLVRIQGGDPHALDELFARHRAEVHRAVARRIEPSLRARVDPSDVVQEAQLDAALRLSDFIERRPMPFRIWILRTAAQRLLKLRRKATAARRDAGRDRPLEDPLGSSRGEAAAGAGIQARALSPSQQAAARDTARRLHAALERLSAPDRTILGLRALEGLSYENVGARLEIEPATARKRYGRALLRLRVLLLADGLTESHL